MVTFRENRGYGTIEMILVLSMLITVALIFREELSGFNERMIHQGLESSDKRVRMTFEGEVIVNPERFESSSKGIISGISRAVGEYISKPIRGWLSQSKAIPIDAQLVSSSQNRSSEVLNRILDQFMVETSPRYKAEMGMTYCNIFAWDATRALGAEIPHWIDRSSGLPYQYQTQLSYRDNAVQAAEMNVNALASWMEVNGWKIGYRRATENEAKEAANSGLPAVAIWKNPSEDKSGHIAILRAVLNEDEIYVAQAGARNSDSISLSTAFGHDRVDEIVFYIHE